MKNNAYIILDVRTPGEFNQRHLKGAVNMDISDPKFMTKLAELDKKKSYRVHCASGGRSFQGTQIMKTLGFKDVENVGGLLEASETLNTPFE